MSIWTIDELEEQIAAWKAALRAVSKGHSYSIEGRTVTRADTEEIRKTLRFLEGEKVKLQTGSGPFMLPGRPKR